MSAFDEGRAAGYRADAENPYRSPGGRCPGCGWDLPRLDCPHEGCNGVGSRAKERAAAEWDAGHAEGEQLARDDLADKRSRWGDN